MTRIVPVAAFLLAWAVPAAAAEPERARSSKPLASLFTDAAVPLIGPRASMARIVEESVPQTRAELKSPPATEAPKE